MEAFASPSIQEGFRQCPKPSREEGSAETADRRYKVCIHIVTRSVYILSLRRFILGVFLHISDSGHKVQLLGFL